MNYSQRIKKIKDVLKKERTDALLISSVPNIIYLTGFSGFSKEEREAYLLITSSRCYIVTDARYSEAVLKQVPHFELTEISLKTPFKTLLKRLCKKDHISSLGIEENNLTVHEWRSVFDIIPHLTNISISREIKEEEEINAIKNACSIGDSAFDYILGKIKPHIRETDLAFELDTFIRNNGGEPSFRTIVAFNQNASVPHHSTGNTLLTDTSGQCILLDFGVHVDNYCSDMTRTVIFGKASNTQKDMYTTVFDAQQKALEYLSTHKDPLEKDVDAASREYITSKGYASIPHSLGHGIGIEVHEEPRISPNGNNVIQEGMVFSVEPGIYIPDFGGVRIEDLVSKTSSGIEKLTTAPSHLIEI